MENSWNALINCEINLDLNWSKKCVLVATATADQDATFSIADTDIYVPVVTLSTHDNVKLLRLIKIWFEKNN